MNTQSLTIDVVNLREALRVYASTTDRAVQNAARDTARMLAKDCTTLAHALRSVECLFDVAHGMALGSKDATVRADMHKRCVVLAHAYNVIRENDPLVLRKRLTTAAVTRRVSA